MSLFASKGRILQTPEKKSKESKLQNIQPLKRREPGQSTAPFFFSFPGLGARGRPSEFHFPRGLIVEGILLTNALMLEAVQS